ncbi:unnamed protein product [Didymodactylos carnosus]|uniref:Uncharacterized protein n=1 Tax=Didymodactylos carnosus TaxID=1234261 RepID=A0A816EJV0_9BILA|nr:unnamed protein product [Didymodactylos carnosus]CAF1673271.1 unnamed protein product [Didymodactylos carnosus]CAF4551415.1 unnamed protein product [Didymodactylos carnosus]CAF4573245.1 unnamed protein product [Didymodactylos carnosus]
MPIDIASLSENDQKARRSTSQNEKIETLFDTSYDPLAYTNRYAPTVTSRTST